MKTWTANVLTLFPEAYPGILGMSVLGKALERRLWKLNLIDIKNFSKKNHKVDDIPFGGGTGMVIKPDVLDGALSSIKNKKFPIYYLTPRGTKFSQKIAEKMSECNGATFLSGRYEGVDQRFIDHHKLIEISIGDYILSGGDLPTMVVLDSIIRLLPEVISNKNALDEESFKNHLLEYPLYTQPRSWKNLDVPEVLLSGDHKKIKDWKIKQSEDITKLRRPDLWKKYLKSK